MNIKDIWEYYGKDLAAAEDKILETLKAASPIVYDVGRHIFTGGGKRMRPLLVILCSRISGYRGEKTATLACSIESIHTASLLHDDVVDSANLRRGRPPAHSVWGNQIAVLAGDFFYSNALRLANSLKNQRIMDALSGATAGMAEKEMLQLTLKGNPAISEDDYMEIITGKTATLMSAACMSGAILGDPPQKKVDALASFGLKLGRAFQVADDILDYMAEEKALGKSLGKDIEEGKITLPLIYLLKKASPDEAERLKAIIREEKLSPADLNYIQDLLKKYKSIEQSYATANAIIQEAKAELNIFDDSMEKRSLLTLLDYALRREK
jgi:octaprenyl-diphosphate synthase